MFDAERDFAEEHADRAAAITPARGRFGCRITCVEKTESSTPSAGDGGESPVSTD